jgi:hypothetical protein
MLFCHAKPGIAAFMPSLQRCLIEALLTSGFCNLKRLVWVLGMTEEQLQLEHKGDSCSSILATNKNDL